MGRHGRSCRHIMEWKKGPRLAALLSARLGQEEGNEFASSRPPDFRQWLAAAVTAPPLSERTHTRLSRPSLLRRAVLPRAPQPHPPGRRATNSFLSSRP